MFDLVLSIVKFQEGWYPKKLVKGIEFGADVYSLPNPLGSSQEEEIESVSHEDISMRKDASVYHLAIDEHENEVKYGA